MIKNNKIIYLKTTTEDGRKTWFVADIKDSIKEAILDKQIKDNKPYNLRDYAEVLYAGREAEAPREVLDYVNKKYNTSF